tara:strand:- start:33412 stop:35406 length:1995 start_codon:yes stop_codon:yes gene_type:complete
MSTLTPKLQPVVNEFSETERSDIARLLIHANDLYQMYNSADTSSEQRKISLDNAFKLITEVMNVAPNNAPALNLLGRIELDRGNISTASALFDKCLNHSPDNTQYLCNKGYLHIIAQEPELAIEYFNKALAIDTRYQNAFLGIARAQHAMQNFDIAYLHYRSLIKHGFDSAPILHGMLSCCSQIKIDQYQKALELDLFTLFAEADLPHERLGHFAASLISKKYDLENPDTTIDLVAVAQDPLVYYSLLKCPLPDPYVEEFITLLRQTILLETLESGSLRDELQALAIAIGVYNERNNYSLITDTLEEEKVSYLDQLLIHTLHHEWQLEDIVGALMVIGMYQAFFSQNYAVRLTAIDLSQWPCALQPLMQSALYRRANREAYKQQFPEKKESLLLAKEDLPAPFPRWHNLDFFNQQSLKQELVSNFQLNEDAMPERLLLLVAGKNAAQRAFEYAHHFNDVDILAVESNLENLAECHLRAAEVQLSNVVFWPNSLAERFLSDGNTIHFASISHDPVLTTPKFLRLVETNLCQEGVLNIKLSESVDTASADIRQLVSKQDLKNTTANIKALRSTILSDKDSAYWSNLIHEEYFYSIDGCRETWFNQDNDREFLSEITGLIKKPSWSLSKVLNHYGKTISITLAEKNLQKIAKENSTHSDYSLYFVKQ